MTRTYYLLGVLLIAATAVITLIAYPQLPIRVPTHWNFQGQVDGYSPKWALFLLGPGTMSAILVLFRFLPWLSPKRFEVESFRSTYERIMLMTLGMLAGLQAIELWAALGHHIDVGRSVVGLICLLFMLLGNVLGKVRRNFYIGVRTPWSLASERVWNATHRLAAKTFVGFGILGLVLTLAGAAMWLPFAAVLAAAFIPVGYSLVLYKRLERARQL